jgi:HK97 family phage prohead protease
MSEPITPEVTKPPKLERCVQHLIGQGHRKESAYAICNATLEAIGEPEEEKDPVPVKLAEESGAVRKFYVAETKTLKNGDIEAYVSTGTPDRVGDMVKTSGWELDNYKKTGSPVLFGHEYSITPGGHIPLIGNAVEMEAQRKGLWSITRFHEKTQLSRDAAVLAREKLMPNWSVGFNPIDQPEARKDADGNFMGYVFSKQELLEYSLVPVPANPEAVSKAIWMSKRGLITHQLAAIIAGPSPLADEDDAVFGGKEEAQRAKLAIEQHEMTILGNHFIKRYFDGRH